MTLARFPLETLRQLRGFLLLSACLALLSAFGRPMAHGAQANRPPNVVFLLADDLGYGDLGCFGQKKIRTPNLDSMAAQGMRLTQHYSGNAVCAPSRCVLMTGLHPGHAFIRTNRAVKPEGQYPIPADTVTLAKLLQAQGYATGGFGKWGLGPPGSHADPLRQGFDRFFGFNCQSVAHNYYPTYLWSDDRRVPLDNPDFPSRGRLPAGADPNDPASYRQYSGKQYAADLIGQQALEFVRRHKDEPFFLYLPTTVPHLALQVPEDSLAEYKGAFPETPYVGDRGYLPHRTPRAAYAAMITRMDRDIGRIVDLVAELGLAEQTIFIFTSDNGPLYDELGGTDTEFFRSADPLRGRKGSLYEGGIRVPGIVRWKGRVKPGSNSDRVSGFEDWLPTILELIGATDSIPAKLDGISLAPTLLGETQPPRPFLYREFPSYGGQQSLRMGDWKAVRQNLAPQGKNARPDLSIELYNLADDVGETRDVSDENPQIVKRMETIMRNEHTPSPEFPLKALDEL
jgi:arylsulfatase A